jgi:hypothetical protein
MNGESQPENSHAGNSSAIHKDQIVARIITLCLQFLTWFNF